MELVWSYCPIGLSDPKLDFCLLWLLLYIHRLQIGSGTWEAKFTSENEAKNELSMSTFSTFRVSSTLLSSGVILSLFFLLLSYLEKPFLLPFTSFPSPISSSFSNTLYVCLGSVSICPVYLLPFYRLLFVLELSEEFSAHPCKPSAMLI